MLYKKLLIFFLVLPLVSGLYDKQIYDGWVKSGEYLEIEQETYRAIYLKHTNTTVVYFPNGLSAVIDYSNSTCASEWLYRACQSDYKFEKNGVEVPTDIHDPYVDVFMYLTIDVTDIDLILTREFDAENLFVGDTIEFVTTIEKKGTEEITNITFQDVFSNDFSINVKSGCEKRRNSVMWRGNLNTSLVCKYVVVPLKATNYNNLATLNYNVFDKPLVKTDEYLFDIRESPLSYEVDYPTHNITIGEIIKINLTLDVLKDLSIMQIKIDYPDYFKLYNYSADFKETKNGLLISTLDLKKDDQKNFNVELKTGFEGNHQINFSLIYVFSGLVKEITKDIIVTYVGDMFYIDLYKKENKSILRIANPSDSYFRDIQILIHENELKLRRLDANKFKEFELFLEDDQHNILVQYRNMFGQILNTEFELQHGETTYVGDIEEQEEPKEEKQDVAVVPQDEQSISFKTIALIVGVLFFAMLVLTLISSIKSKVGKSNLDKEIEDLKKQRNEKL